MNPRRRRNQRIARRRRRCMATIMARVRASTRRMLEAPVGIVSSYDPVTGIAEIEIGIQPMPTTAIRTVVQLEQTFGEGAPVVRELKP